MGVTAIQPPPQRYARLGGVLYLLIFGLGFTLFAFPDFSAGGAAAVHTIATSQPHLRLMIALEAVFFSIDTPLGLIFYVLLRPVDRNVALLAAVFRIANSVFGEISILPQLALLALVGNASYRQAFTSKQLQTLGAVLSTIHGNAQDIGLIFFGFHCILLGILIYRSGYLPKFIGAILPIAGAIYAANSFADIIAPAFTAQISLAVFVPAFVAEASLCLWLLIRGIDPIGWTRRRYFRENR